MLPFAQFDSYATSAEEEAVLSVEIPKPVAAPTPKRKNKVTKKRKRVGRACVFCQRSHMSCDEQRPCKRCVARGCGDQCRDGKRKRRGRKRKTPLPDDEDIDDEFDEFEPLDKQFKDDSDTEEELEDDHAHCNHGDAMTHDHHHHHHTVPAITTTPANFNTFQLFDDEDEENSLSNSSNSVPLLKVKSEYEAHADEVSPSRPTTPALPIPLRNPRVAALSNAAATQTESSSPSTQQPSFEALYPSFFEPAAPCSESSSAPHHHQSSIDVDSFFASEPAAPCAASRLALNFFEDPAFAEPDASF